MDTFDPRQLSLFDSPQFYEAADIEFKSAKGGVPGSLWETYSAFANTDGGTIYLGIAEKGEFLDFHGVSNPDKVINEIYSTANSSKVSVGLLRQGDVTKIDIDSKGTWVIGINVRRASRQERPVYLNNKPLSETYRRDHSGDYRCNADEVGRMFADQSVAPSDSRILEHFSFDDIHLLSVQQFRQRVSSANPTHPWLLEDDVALFEKLGGWRRERGSGLEGITVAGLLMFGKEQAIKSPEALPHYHLDYRERPSDGHQERWTDRLTLDGIWEGNLFQFYNKVLPRLASTLKAPFQLDSNLYRYNESAVGAALREAVVNALIHADYTGQGGIVIDRYPDRIELSNPGTLLISHEQILKGGISECRNKSLQAMFQLMGAGDRAGSGLDKIRASWESARFRAPSLLETQRPDRVKLELPMSSILPEEAVGQLAHQFGPMFNELEPSEVQILVMAFDEGPITNARLQNVLTMHRVDLTKVLQRLAKDGFLERKGFGRWTTYQLPAVVERLALLTAVAVNGRAEGTVDGTPDGSADGTLDSERPELPSISVRESNPGLWAKLMEIGKPARARRVMMTGELTAIVFQLCSQGEWLTRDELGELVGRNGTNLRDRTLAQMVAENRLQLRYASRNHPNQAYRASDN